MSTKRFVRSMMAFLLVFCMMAGYFVMPVEAEETDFHYVSLGASNTNGYGLRGYITEEELAALLSGEKKKDEVNVYGYERIPEGGYPDLIRDYYEGIYDNVTVNQLAISSMRVEELRILLDEDYKGDDYSSWRFTCPGGWFTSAEPGGVDELRKAYKSSIADADLVTVDIGWNNFGVYVCNQLVDYMKTGNLKWSTDLAKIFKTSDELDAAETAKDLIGNYVSENIDDEELASVVTDIFAYSYLGYVYNFDKVMGIIYELNPDVDIVVLGIQNLLHGVNVELGEEEFALGDIFGNFVNMANYYISARSPYQSNYQYVKAGDNEHVTLFLDFMKSYKNNNGGTLNQNVKDCFDYYDNDLYLQSRVDKMAEQLIQQKYGEQLSLVGLSSAEEAVKAGKAGKLNDTPLGEAMDLQGTFDKLYYGALYAGYDTMAQFVRDVEAIMPIDASGLLSGDINLGAVEDALVTSLEDELVENAMAAVNGESYTVDTSEILNDNDPAYEAAASMYVRYYMGNSFFAHPNEEGHNEIKSAILNVINNPDSEKDQALKADLVDSVKKIQTLLCDATGHKAEYFVSETEGNCQQEGTIIKACACGQETAETKTVLGDHSYKAVVTEPTCTEAGFTTYTCEFCKDSYVADEVKALDHTWDEGVVTKEPTETEKGIRIYTCTVCKETKTEDIEVVSHTHDYKAVVTAPTCTEKGYTTYTCVCGESYVADEVPAAHTEVIDKGVPATCLKSGISDGKHCSACGEVLVEQEPIERLEHTVVTDKAVPATCTEEGLTEGTHCSVCGSTLTIQRVVPATGHKWNDGVVTKEPTETETGIRTLTCTVCKETKTEVIPELGHVHSYTTAVTKPTCTEKGYTAHTCKCGDSYITDEVPALGHSYGEPEWAWSEDYKAVATFTCKNCEEETVIDNCEVTVEIVDNKYVYTATCEFEGKTYTSKAPQTTVVNPFEDVEEGRFYYDAVLWAVENDITTGVDATHFAPSKNCTRGDIVTFLWRANGCPAPTIKENPFVDVEEGRYYYDAVLWAYEKGITTGTDETHFVPGETCTRAQIVTFLWRAEGMPEAKETKNPFVDVKENAYYTEAVLWAVENGITKGTDETHFVPAGTCSRGEAVTFLYRVYK